jgi:prepilin-type N-terminal cleavage/methylation domain-containing protein
MLRQLRKMRRDEGFTLIELLIVIVILGILAAVVVFAVGGITDRGTKSACKANVQAASTAVEAYRANSAGGTYPVDFNAMVPQYLKNLPAPQVVLAPVTVGGATYTFYYPVVNTGGTSYSVAYDPVSGTISGANANPPTVAAITAGCPA